MVCRGQFAFFHGVHIAGHDLEAFAAGRPILGMKLGGIAELVRDNVDGMLVPDHVTAWTSMLVRLAGDRTLVSRLQQNVCPVRSSSDVASEMLSLYGRTA